MRAFSNERPDSQLIFALSPTCASSLRKKRVEFVLHLCSFFVGRETGSESGISCSSVHGDASKTTTSCKAKVLAPQLAGRRAHCPSERPGSAFSGCFPTHFSPFSDSRIILLLLQLAAKVVLCPSLREVRLFNFQGAPILPATVPHSLRFFSVQLERIHFSCEAHRSCRIRTGLPADFGLDSSAGRRASSAQS